MRTIELTEHQPKVERLSAVELDELLALGLAAVAPRADGSYLITPGSCVGTVVLRHVRLLVRPKAPLANVMLMLSYGTGIVRWRDERFPYGTADDLLAAVVTLFAAELRRAHRFGPVRDYRMRTEALTTIRGRVDWAAQLGRRPTLQVPIECEFQDFDEDVELNRQLLAGVNRAARFPGLDVRIRHQLRHARKLFAGVGQREYSSELPDVRRAPNVEPWWPALMLARLILGSDSVRNTTGSHEGASFIVDMNRLFEAFIRVIVHEECRRAGLMLAPAREWRPFTERAGIEPDLLVLHEGVDVAVGDVKYKLGWEAGAPNADRFQLLAYCLALGLDSGLLIYADDGTASRERVVSSGITLELAGVDLAGAPADVLARVRSVARRLIGRAGSTSAAPRLAA